MATAKKCAAGQQKVAVLWSDLRQCWYIAFWSITGTLGRLSAKPPGCSLVSVRSCAISNADRRRLRKVLKKLSRFWGQKVWNLWNSRRVRHNKHSLRTPFNVSQLLIGFSNFEVPTISCIGLLGGRVFPKEAGKSSWLCGLERSRRLFSFPVGSVASVYGNTKRTIDLQNPSCKYLATLVLTFSDTSIYPNLSTLFFSETHGLKYWVTGSTINSIPGTWSRSCLWRGTLIVVTLMEHSI